MHLINQIKEKLSKKRKEVKQLEDEMNEIVNDPFMSTLNKLENEIKNDKLIYFAEKYSTVYRCPEVMEFINNTPSIKLIDDLRNMYQSLKEIN